MDFAKHKNAGESIEVIPANTYKVELNKWEKRSASTGTEQVRWYANVVGGDYDGSPLIDHLALSEKAEWRLAGFVKNCLNLLPEDMEGLGNIDNGSERFSRLMDMCKGRTMWWTIKVDSYNGRDNNKVVDHIVDDKQEKPDLDELDDVPEFVKRKQRGEGKVPF